MVNHTQASGAPVKIGDQAPDFTLPSQTGEHINLYSLLRHGPVVLYFYPRDETGGCTAEACAFRDSYQDFKNAGAEVVGVSGDSVVSHQSFAAKHRLPFVLLADQGQAVSKLYGVSAAFGLLPGRTTYVINQQGVVLHLFNSLLAFRKHSREALSTLELLKPTV